MAKKIKISSTNPYVEMMYQDYKNWAYDEEAAQFRGKWHSQVFSVPDSTPLDLEIGTGNGTHFAWRASQFPHRQILGLELKYKTLVQSIRRARKQGSQNARMLKFRAENLTEIIQIGEINDVFIFFPDPWPKKRQQKNRLIQDSFLKDLHSLMRSGCYLNFKTDDKPYFQWAMHRFRTSPFEIHHYSEDLHNSFRNQDNFKTQFELLFQKKQQPIYSCRLLRP